MRKQFRPFLVVLSLATICIGIGLWMQHRYARASVHNALLQSCFSQLASGALKLLESAGDPGSANQERRLQQWTQRVAGFRAEFGHVSLVDAEGLRILASTAGVGADLAGMPVRDWQRIENATWAMPPPLQRWQVTIGDAVHLAAGFKLPEAEETVLLHTPGWREQERAEMATQDMAATALITFLWVVTLLCIGSYIVFARLFDEARQVATRSETNNLRQVQTLVRTRDAVIFGLAKLAESRDPETGHHLERISVYSTMLATELRRDSTYRDQITPAFIRLIGISSALHDIGKVGVPDSILLKAGKLTDAERVEMERHAGIGGDCLCDIERRLGGSNFLHMAKQIAYAHHEHYDGKGYPNALVAEQIPLAARIVALVDLYDALASARVYKEASKHSDCVEIIRRESGKKLDPEIVRAFLAIESRFETVASRYADGDASVRPAMSFAVDEPICDARAKAELQLVCDDTEGTTLGPSSS